MQILRKRDKAISEAAYQTAQIISDRCNPESYLTVKKAYCEAHLQTFV